MAIKDFLSALSTKTILFDGGMGTELYSRGFFINRCYEEVNLTNSDIILKVHKDYIEAGADVIETNTYAANRFKLKKHQLDDKLYEINLNGAKIARQAAGNETYVAGSIGPLGVQIEPLGPISTSEARAYFQEQMRGLIDGGVDLFIFETFIYAEELKQAVAAAREICSLPVIALLTINDDATSLTGASPEVLVKDLEMSGADVIGINCTVGPQIMLNWLEAARKHTDLPLAVMPNAGKPKNIDGRNIYLTSPEYLGEYAKHFVQTGANVIGGCCGTGPEHIKRMRNMLNALNPENSKKKFKIVQVNEILDVQVMPTEKKSRLARRIKDGHIVKFVELLAPHGVSAEKEIEKAREMHHYGIDVINIPDGPRASARMSALALAVQLQREVGIETVLHYVCRDRNVIGIQSDLLGAFALGLKNILAITGDPPKLGNYPDATAVFDVDAIGLTNILFRLNHGMDIAGNPIGKPSAFFVGVGANPGAINLDEEIRRLDWKVDAGAEYIVTQPVFDVAVFENFLSRIQHINIPIIAGIWPLVSLRNAEFMNNEVPGCNVPDKIMNRLKKYQNSKEASLKEGIEIAREIIGELLGKINGLQISAPFGRVQSVIDVLDGVKLY
ncbi:MAG: bifunctional homocysteine S-methyltransferase/methylenetetrahydrofolate reductase [Candidatus Kapabacteria bacterium]|nr:bifunctional homocysteine S-methyltransferase/methylenetetrahydrofolate reductase [Candidatus Kapabacteria bacterium]